MARFLHSKPTLTCSTRCTLAGLIRSLQEQARDTPTSDLVPLPATSARPVASKNPCTSPPLHILPHRLKETGKMGQRYARQVKNPSTFFFLDCCTWMSRVDGTSSKELTQKIPCIRFRSVCPLGSHRQIAIQKAGSPSNLTRWEHDRTG